MVVDNSSDSRNIGHTTLRVVGEDAKADHCKRIGGGAVEANKFDMVEVLGDEVENRDSPSLEDDWALMLQANHNYR